MAAMNGYFLANAHVGRAGPVRGVAWRLAGMALLAAALCPLMVRSQAAKDNVAGPYVPTPWEIVDVMLKLGDVAKGDTLYDLGSGDGRLVITAAKRHGARGVGIELQPQLVDMARKQASKEGVADRVKFVVGDLFEADLSGASIVTLYLLPQYLTRLVPKLRAELAPGARIVSHDYELSPWRADRKLSFDVLEKEAISGTTRTVIYYYVVPARVAGTWALTIPRAVSPAPIELKISQSPELLDGVATIGDDTVSLRDIYLRADAIQFSVFHRGRLMHFKGKVTGREMSGEFRQNKLVGQWSASLAAP